MPPGGKRERPRGALLLTRLFGCLVGVRARPGPRYFNMCDTDGGGDIDLDEFRSALFAIDPNTGNTTGFQPSALLGPKDAFELFDVDKSGSIDEDEFAFVMEYMNVDMGEMDQENMFAKYDKDGSGTISYDEFRSIWIKVCNVKRELEDREVRTRRPLSAAAGADPRGHGAALLGALCVVSNPCRRSACPRLLCCPNTHGR